MNKQEKLARLCMAILGVLVGGISVGFFRVAMFGSDPFQCFVAGVDSAVWLSFGTVYMLMNMVLFGVMFFFGKRYIGIATFINLFLLGYVVEWSEAAILSVVGDPTVVIRSGCLLIGVVVLCFASAVYFTADLGVSTYDAVALMLAERSKIPFQVCRVGTDLICVAIGLGMGTVIGVGTLVTAFFMGPLIGVFRKQVTEPFLAQYQKEDNTHGRTNTPQASGTLQRNPS
ncbi:hypothetical protein RFF05_15195 [Bengtsoniella intestinalis]|uniref:YczE/YyaS/YitT family protein n=1 Tax=Bengtsoniella intestinalis TaxID=3073143 RepID=UPI00391EE600